MHLTDDQHSQGPTDCNALKASLSAYLDDELTRDERLRADAHLIGCGDCRGLVERAEALDASLRAKFAEDLADAEKALEADPVDVAAMQRRVLAAIGHEHRQTWLPRLAAAAAVTVVAGTAWLIWSSRETPSPLSPTAPGTFVRGDDAPASRPVGPVDAPAGAAVRLAGLSDDDLLTLQNLGSVLDSTRRTAFIDESRRTMLRDMVRYEELIEKVDQVIAKLPPEEQQTVALARDATARIADASSDPRQWLELQQDVERGRLAPSIEMMSEAR